ncbi:MAG: tetratricopeptide repeat protein, partial [Ketobacter sp.]|nr:tetratricopeptide repeat protein [Ketobacter sp.]
AEIEAAQRWVMMETRRIDAKQVIAPIYIRQNKGHETYTYLNGLIQDSELTDKQLFVSMLTVLGREKNTNTVAVVTREIAKTYPDRAYALYLHGMIAAQSGKSAEALDHIDRALSIEEIEDAHSARARLLLKLGRREEAVISLEKAIERLPDDQNLRLAYARLLVDVK